jgi:hypothetical protein
MFAFSNHLNTRGQHRWISGVLLAAAAILLTACTPADPALKGAETPVVTPTSTPDPRISAAASAAAAAQKAVSLAVATTPEGTPGR